MKLANVFFLAAALFASAAFAGSEDRRGPITFKARDGSTVNGLRCGTPNHHMPEAGLRAVKRAASSGIGPNMASPIVVPIAFHVINSSSLPDQVSDQMLWDQVDVLNAAYALMGLQFTIGSIDRTTNDVWYRDGDEFGMKAALAADSATNMNVYVNSPSGGILGYAYLPWSFAEGDYRDGITLLNETLPGGTAAPYNEGDTLTHEVGHWLGLYHTFENGCNVPSDYVQDTAFEASPAYGCPVGRNSCSADPRTDPITNFMDYVDDSCMIEFTRQQYRRMRGAVAVYRPSLLP